MLSGSTFAVILACALLLTVGFALLPSVAKCDDDQGDGLGRVVLPKPAKAVMYRRRTILFFVVGSILTMLAVGSRRYPLEQLYAHAVGALATNLTGRPAEVQAFLQGFSVRIQLLWVVAIFSLAAVLRATSGRRLVVALHAVPYLLVAMVLQAVAIAVGIRTNLPVRPVTICAVIIDLTAGVVVFLRVVMTTFMLPKANALPNTRRHRSADDVMMAATLVVGAAVIVFGLSLVANPSFAGSEWRLFVPMAAVVVFTAVTGVGLLVLGAGLGPLPRPLDQAPPLDIITPMYNEQAGVAGCLRSIDQAAGRYGGPVRAIVSNDGSTDGSVQIASGVMRDFQHATGVLIDHYPNTGKAGALNRALAAAETDIVVRLDADCLLQEDALRYTAPWFNDPSVGVVGALMLPRDDCDTWYARMRGVECLFGFGCSRLGQQIVDGVTVVPGTYTAFRREPMIESGGFVEGMNGEDADQTCQFGRMNYRVVVDRRIRCFEDVPPTLNELLEQRSRWARAGLHVFARHNTLRNGFAGPRVWFYLWRRAIQWAVGPVILLAPLYLVLLLGQSAADRKSIVYLITIPLVIAAVGLLLLLWASMRYRYWKSLLWFPTFMAFAVMRRVALLEAFLSMPTRPVLARNRTAVPDPGSEPTPREQRLVFHPSRLRSADF